MVSIDIPIVEFLAGQTIASRSIDIVFNYVHANTYIFPVLSHLHCCKKCPQILQLKTFFLQMYAAITCRIYKKKYFEGVIDPWNRGNILMWLKKCCPLKGISYNLKSILHLVNAQGNFT